ncbi:MAG: YkgJ family cysteine cluster protein [Flavobacteriales bacterium]
MEEAEKSALARAVARKKENKKFLKGLSHQSQLDRIFHERHYKEFEKMDCLTCANCCRTTSPIFRDVDIDRISKHMNLRPSDFIHKYLHLDEDQDWVLNTAPCPFLQTDNTCSIYENRPRACRDYPHTDRKNMSQILDLTYRNTLVCPAVARIVEDIRNNL